MSTGGYCWECGRYDSSGKQFCDATCSAKYHAKKKEHLEQQVSSRDAEIEKLRAEVERLKKAKGE